MEQTHNQASGQTSKLYPWFILGIVMVIYIFSFLDRQIIAVVANGIRQELGLNNTQVGILYGPAFSFLYAICGIWMGHLADRYSRKYIIITGLIIWSLMTLASGFATSFSFLVTVRLFIGVSQSALSPAVYSLLSDYFPPSKRASVFSLYASGIFLGIGLSFLIGGSVAQAYDWRIAIQTVAWPGLLLAVFAVFALKEPKRFSIGNVEENAVKPFFQVLKYILKKKTVRLHLMGFSLLALSGYTILAFISTVFGKVYDAPSYISKYGWFMFLTGASINISGWLADKLAKKWGAEKRFIMGIVAALGGLPFYAIGFFSHSVVTAFLFIGLGNVVSSSYNGIAAAIIQYFVKAEMRGLAGAIYLFVISVVGFGFGPPATGWLIDHIFTGEYGTSRALFMVFAVCGSLATLCFLAAMKSYHNDAEPD